MFYPTEVFKKLIKDGEKFVITSYNNVYVVANLVS